jgi:hypothetical protein
MILLLILIQPLLLMALFAENNASAKMSETTHGFESVIEGDKVFHDFIIKNIGSTPLKNCNNRI